MPKPPERVRLLVVGNVTEDLGFRVPDLPRPGETLICEARSEDLGGKGLNQAVVAARCGITVTLLSPVGRDAIAERVRALATVEGLAAKLPAVTEHSDLSVIAVARSGENTIISSAMAADALSAATAIAGVDGLGDWDAVLVQGNLSQPTTQAVLSAARAQGAVTFANPSPIRWEWGGLWPLVDTVILNRLELEALTGTPAMDAGIETLHAVDRFEPVGALEATSRFDENAAVERVAVQRIAHGVFDFGQFVVGAGEPLGQIGEADLNSVDVALQLFTRISAERRHADRPSHAEPPDDRDPRDNDENAPEARSIDRCTSTSLPGLS